MKTKEVLIIGAGIAGCAVGLALVKRGISVTVINSPFDQRLYHSSFIQYDKLEEKVKNLQKEKQEQLNCTRAYEQLMELASQSVEELLDKSNLVERHGNIDIHRSLQEQLREHAKCEWLSNYTLIELLTLDQHSQKKVDRYKKQTCIGAVVYNHTTQRIENLLAKEIILATGGASSLFPYSTQPTTACGSGIAIGYRAGARLLNLEQIQFQPLGLYGKDRPCLPLPLGLLNAGGKILSTKSTSLEIDCTSPVHLLHQLHSQLIQNNSDHLWLDLTFLDHEVLKDKFPSLDANCLSYGYNIVKDLLPIVPIAVYTCGGIAIDKVAQTSVQRLRAIGEVACSGLFWNSREEAISVLESLTWALACAEDIVKQLNRFIYYFPEVRDLTAHLNTSCSVLEEDWKTLRQIMWMYVGIQHDQLHVERGCSLLDQLAYLNTPQDYPSCSIEQIQLYYAIQTAQLIAHAIKSQQGSSFSRAQQPLAAFQKNQQDALRF